MSGKTKQTVHIRYTEKKKWNDKILNVRELASITVTAVKIMKNIILNYYLAMANDNRYMRT